MLPPRDGLRLIARLVWRTAPRKVITAGVVMLGIGLTEGAGLAMLVPLLGIVGIDRGTSAGTGSVSGALQRFSTFIGVEPTLPLVLAIYVGIAWAQASLTRFETRISGEIQEELMAAERLRLYNAVALARWEFLATRRLPTFAHLLTQEIERIGGVTWLVVDWVVSATIAVVYLGVAIRLSPATTSAVLVAAAVVGWIVRRRIAESQRTGEALSAVGERVLSTISDHLASLKTARSVGATRAHAEEFASLIDESRTVRLRSIGQSGRLRHQLTLGSTVALAGIVYVAHAVVGLGPASLLLLVFVYGRLMPRLVTLYERLHYIARDLTAVTVVEAAVGECEAEAEPAATAAPPLRLEQEVRFEAVGFSYAAEAAWRLETLDFAIEAGSTTAIVGPSGAGKSTLADLLTGLLTPQQGRVLIDGRPLETADRDRWRSGIGYVPQEAWFFHDTIRRNLTWARPGIREDDLWIALEQAAAAEFVRSLPGGLDGMMGDRGVLLSGGERQRLALARALVRRPQVLILDEATSALDAENEARIVAVLRQLKRQVTIVMITHRLTLAREADSVYVMEAGRIVESGRWSSLMQRPESRLRGLWNAAHDGRDVPRPDASAVLVNSLPAEVGRG